MLRARRTPRGVRGLKYGKLHHFGLEKRSHPARGAWIEIAMISTPRRMPVSHPARGAWIEIIMIRYDMLSRKSHPARGAWIEI